MDDRLPAHHGTANLKWLAGHVMQDHVTAKAAQAYGEQRWRQVARQALSQVGVGRSGSPDMQLDVRSEARLEEAEALEVIQVQVAQHQVDSTAVAAEAYAQRTDAGAGVEHDQRSVGSNLHAGRVAAVPHRVRPRAGHGSTRTPQSDAQRLALLRR